MKINEVEQQVNITKKNIRFYEQQGLLSPKRNLENGYRDYSEEDVTELKKIKMLRKLSLPLEEIRRIQKGDLILTDALQRQVILLERERASLEETTRLCQLLSEETCQYQTFSPDKYLERMVEMEQEGTKFLNVNRHDIRQKKLGPIIFSFLFILIMIGSIAGLIWEYVTDSISLWLMVLFLLIPITMILSVIAVLLQRMKEIEGGEEDVARKY
mgnify:CR=1 FL=1|jgi:DNA-binding transcriptional MerR regulator